MTREGMSSLVLLGLSVYICIETALRLPIGSLNSPGPGLWPLGVGISLGVMSGGKLVRAIMADEGGAEGTWYPQQTWPRIAGIVVALLIYTALLEPLGFVLDTFLLLVVLFRTPEPPKWRSVLLGSAAATAATYVVFEIWLQMQLPKGPLGF